MVLCCFSLFFFFKAPAPPEIYTLSLHDALPISVLAEALRPLAILRRHRDEPTWARELCQRSYEVARQIGNDLLAAEALNTLGGLDLAAGSLAQAATTFLRPADLGGSSPPLPPRAPANP